MSEFVLGLQAGAVLLVACSLFTFTIFTFFKRYVKINKVKTKPPCEKVKTSVEKRTNKEELELLTAKAAVQNFYLYDGSPQRDPGDIAQDVLDNRGGKGR